MDSVSRVGLFASGLVVILGNDGPMFARRQCVVICGPVRTCRVYALIHYALWLYSPFITCMRRLWHS